MIKIVIFDLGKVLLDFNNHLVSGRLAVKTGRPEEEIHRIVFGKELEQCLDRGTISPEEFFRSLKEKLSLSISFEEFVPIWCSIFVPQPGMLELVAQLKRNCRLGILSNTNELHFEYLKKEYPVLSLFDDYHLSYRLKLLKPDPAIYRHLTDFYRVPPQEILYFDDIPGYVESARAAGIEAVKFESAEQAKSELVKRGVTAA